ncbi:MAG: hypothetical protein IJX13_08295 [Clostridia bacterium]|nr:hypothetical protein [Clostridia bacterium]
MKKKNIAILLLLPYVIALLGVIAVNITFKAFQNDISHIEWEYGDTVTYQIRENARYPLQATGINASNLPLAEGNTLVWSVKNSDGAEEPHAEIIEENGQYYLVPISEGNVIITCSNQKGNVTRKTEGIVYLNSVIYLESEIQSSQNNIDPNVYYGEYDLKDGKKVRAQVKFKVVSVPASMEVEAKTTPNISFDRKTGILTVKGHGPATLTLTGGKEEDNTKTSRTYSYQIVDEGVNVYTYEDLLNCTNLSKEGEVVVLRKSFDTYKNTYYFNSNGEITGKKANNVECFGVYDANLGKCLFSDEEIYWFHTTYNRSYIDQWNAFAKSNGKYREISDIVNVGIHVQKDFYGNGYTINLHNLTFPTDGYLGADKETGQDVWIPELSDTDKFRGPLSFYTLGDPNDMPLITAYGQDNIGMYVDGNNIKVNDINIRNCDVGNSFSNLETVGTVLEINGDNVTVSNSVLQYGRNIIRAYSSHNTRIENCLIENAMNFLVMLGSYEYADIDGSKTFTFPDPDQPGKSVRMTLDDYLAVLRDDGHPKNGNDALNAFLEGSYTDAEQMRSILQALQDALNASVDKTLGGSVEIKDTLFYRSGIASIALESAFNGPFLYTPSPSMINDLFSAVTLEGKPLVPLTPTNVSGASRPVELKITGSTKFYDYKTREDLDLSGLIDENISPIIQRILEKIPEMADKNIQITIDDIFPLKSMLYRDAAKIGSSYANGGSTYVNIPIAFYGGGLNLSTVSFEGLENADVMNDALAVDWIGEYTEMAGGGTFQAAKGMMQKMVTVVAGFDPFRFVCYKGNGYLFGELPTVEELRSNN